MNLRLVPIDPDRDSEDLVRFLAHNRFPFHVGEQPDEDEARARVESGDFSRPDNVAYWIESDGARIGFLNFEEFLDGTPMIDLRLAEEHRGQGIGTLALGLGTSQIFAENPRVQRIEGNTRADNVAMRRAFEANLYVKEAHYRDGWTVEGGEPTDSVAYATLRRDWEKGSVTPVDWDA